MEQGRSDEPATAGDVLGPPLECDAGTLVLW